MEQTDTREILWANVEALMTTAYGKERLSKFAEETGIGNATMTRIKAKSSYPNSETLERIAEKFSLEPWQLLAPNLGRDADAAAPPSPPPNSALDGGGQSPQSHSHGSMPVAVEDSGMSESEKRMLLSLFSKLGAEDRNRLLAQMFELGQAQESQGYPGKNVGTGT